MMTNWILPVGYVLLVIWTVYQIRGMWSELRSVLPDLRKIGILQSESPLAIMRNGMREMANLIIFMSQDNRRQEEMMKEIDDIPDIGTALVHMKDLRHRLINETVKFRLLTGGLGDARRVSGTPEA